MVRIIHSAVKGRVRLKVQGLYRSESLKAFIAQRLQGREGIESFSLSTLTGNVLIFYNTDQTAQSILFVLHTITEEYYANNKPNRGYNSNNSSNNQNNKPTKVRRIESPRKIRQAIRKSEEQTIRQWHLLDPEEVLRIFETSKDTGLSFQRVEEYLKKYGPNYLPELVPRSGLKIFLRQFNSLPVYLLSVASAISVATGGLLDAIVIMSVVFINALIGYVTEIQTEKIIHSLKSLLRPYAFVLRDGKVREIEIEKIVPGDILMLKPGSYVAADARLIEVERLTVDESALTGESMPITKTVPPIVYPEVVTGGQNPEIPLGDRTNMVYMGTLVTGGQGKAVVVATGRFTELGRIQALISKAKDSKTPLQRQLDRLGEQIVYIGCITCGCIFGIGLLRGFGLIQMLQLSISLAVASVPEGLPTLATTTLALGVRNMRRHKVLVRNLSSVETLGAIQTVCLDKTGTITLNEMSVSSLYVSKNRIRFKNGLFIGPDGVIDPRELQELEKLIEVSVLCNETKLRHENGDYVLKGSSTEIALINMAIMSELDVKKIRYKYPLLKTNHRTENQNYMLTYHRMPKGDLLVALKGSPTEVLGMCKYVLKDGHVSPLDEEERLNIQNENERMSSEALRVLGVAYAIYEENGGFQISDYNSNGAGLDFIWLGLVGMEDPIREGVKELISEFHRAGIDTVMITGDQRLTACAIGKKLGISKGGQLKVLDYMDIANWDTERLHELCQGVHIFARVSPASKLQIVEALKSSGKVVAMTGDGINDGPALKAADVGIAMGHRGTDVAREVADVVLEDDNLNTLVVAIEQGRTIYENIQKSIKYLLATNMSELILMSLGVVTGLGQPLTAMQLLWINLISDIAPGLAISLEQPEPDILKRPPRDVQKHIVGTEEFKRISFESFSMALSAFLVYWYAKIRYGNDQRASTMAFMTLTMAQILHAISARSNKYSIFDSNKMPPNKYLKGALLACIGLQIFSYLLPPIRRFLGLSTIGIADMLLIGFSSIVPLFVNELTKKTNKNLSLPAPHPAQVG